jgi:hypothetical protein
LDSIAGFVLLLVAATIFGAWFATCGPGLSHIGVQIILAFYLVNLSSLKLKHRCGRVGIASQESLIGLLVMWIVFGQLGFKLLACRSCDAEVSPCAFANSNCPRKSRQFRWNMTAIRRQHWNV